jgi:branched-chain amino acid transport system ATP-binding protein
MAARRGSDAEGLTSLPRAAPGAPAARAGGFAGSGIEVRYDGVSALQGVDVHVEPGEIVGLIGPNGAGKTTLVNVLTGFERPTTGLISIGGRDATGLSPARIARRGVARTFQGGRSFAELTVAENVEVGAIGLGVARREARRRVAEVVRQVGLAGSERVLARALPAGDERRLQIARALAARPSYLLLDEPAAGLNEQEGDELAELIAGLPRELGCGVLVIDHDMRLIMGLCDRLQVLDHGVTISEGTPAEVRADPAVIAAYLGSEGDGAAA